MMIRPKWFGFNSETAENNLFQKRLPALSEVDARRRGVEEFDGLVSTLRKNHVEVLVQEDVDSPQLPDAVFPNNWISFHRPPKSGSTGKIILYPMMSALRRKERRLDIVQRLRQSLGSEVLDFSNSEEMGEYLEGTGSMVLDRDNQIAYACRSPRTHTSVLEQFCQAMDYKPIVFDATQRSPIGSLHPIYHTNVLISIGAEMVLVCLESIRNHLEQQAVTSQIESTGKLVVPITEEQMNNFLGNALQLIGKDGRNLLVMSTKAYNSLKADQRKLIEKSSTIIHSNVDTIEALGGGGVRCMIAEIFP